MLSLSREKPVHALDFKILLRWLESGRFVWRGVADETSSRRLQKADSGGSFTPRCFNAIRLYFSKKIRRDVYLRKIPGFNFQRSVGNFSDLSHSVCSWSVPNRKLLSGDQFRIRKIRKYSCYLLKTFLADINTSKYNQPLLI